MSTESDKKDAEIMTGHTLSDAEGVTPDADGGSPTKAEVPAAPSVSSFEVAGKTFASKDEAANYVRQLENEKVAAEAYLKGVRESLKPATDVAAPVNLMEQLQEDFFNDPAKTLVDVEERATKKAMQMIEEKQKLSATWNNFYAANPDMKNRQELVEAMVMKYAQVPEYQKMSMEEGLAKMADKVRQQLGTTKEITSKAAVTGGVSAGATGGVTQTKTQPVDFFSQVRQYQRRS